MLSPQSSVAARLKELGVDEEIAFNIPPRPEMGDFSTPVALKLAKSRRQAPLAIANELLQEISTSLPPYILAAAVSPPGFLNFFLDNRQYVEDLLREVSRAGDDYGSTAASPDDPTSKKVLIEHTNVNPNKAMHVGHVRNAVLGDTIVRTLRRAGRPVEVCNYIDDTGIQVVDVVTAMLYLDEPYYGDNGAFSAVWAKADPSLPFDHFCWDLYARAQDYLKPAPAMNTTAVPERAKEMQRLKQTVMHALEERDHPIAHFAKELASRIVSLHLQSAARLNVFYDLLNWESDVLGEGFWGATFQRLRETGAIRLEESGVNAGCWVVPHVDAPAEDEPVGSDAGATSDDTTGEAAEGARNQDKILVRSNGTATYTAKDIAYQLWKFGRLDADFHYKLWGQQPNGEPLWTTAPDGETRTGFGHAARVINVIDARQSGPQQTVYRCLDRLGFAEEAANSIHLGYEVVKLTGKTARELGVEGDASQDVSMSGRKGLGVKADDFMDWMAGIIRTRALESKKSNPDINAEALAAAAIRHYMLRFSTNTIIRFDFDVASQTTGDTGVYLVYSYARACSVLAKAAEYDDDPATGQGSEEPAGSLQVPAELSAFEKSLVWELGRFGDVVQLAAETLSTTPLTAYAFGLASAFAGFYEDMETPVFREPDQEKRSFRLALVTAFRQVMKNTLDTLGIPALERV